MRLIDADRLSYKVKCECNPYGKPTIDYESGKKVLDWIDNAPTVERPQGEWIDYSEDDGYVECPFCECATNCEGNIDELHYCWNCGAEMRKETDNE